MDSIQKSLIFTGPKSRYMDSAGLVLAGCWATRGGITDGLSFDQQQIFLEAG